MPLLSEKASQSRACALGIADEILRKTGAIL
jgi:hypothetical protein